MRSRSLPTSLDVLFLRQEIPTRWVRKLQAGLVLPSPAKACQSLQNFQQSFPRRWQIKSVLISFGRHGYMPWHGSITIDPAFLIWFARPPHPSPFIKLTMSLALTSPVHMLCRRMSLYQVCTRVVEWYGLGAQGCMGLKKGLGPGTTRPWGWTSPTGRRRGRWTGRRRRIRTTRVLVEVSFSRPT